MNESKKLSKEERIAARKAKGPSHKDVLKSNLDKFKILEPLHEGLKKNNSAINQHLHSMAEADKQEVNNQLVSPKEVSIDDLIKPLPEENKQEIKRLIIKRNKLKESLKNLMNYLWSR